MHLLALVAETLGLSVIIVLRAFANMISTVVVQPYLKLTEWLEALVYRLEGTWSHIR